MSGFVGADVDSATSVGTGMTLDGASFDKGDMVFVQGVVNDGVDNGDALDSDALMVYNTAPKLGYFGDGTGYK